MRLVDNSFEDSKLRFTIIVVNWHLVIKVRNFVTGKSLTYPLVLKNLRLRLRRKQ